MQRGDDQRGDDARRQPAVVEPGPAALALDALVRRQQQPDEMVDQADRQHHRADGHDDLRDPHRRGVEPLADVVPAGRADVRLDGVAGEEDRSDGGCAIAPELGIAAPAAEPDQHEVDPYMRAPVHRIGEREEARARHGVACIIGRARQHPARPARHHLGDDQRQDRHHEDAAEGAAGEVERVEAAAKRPHGRPPVRWLGEPAGAGDARASVRLVGVDDRLAFLAGGLGPLVDHGLADTFEVALQLVAGGLHLHAALL